MRHQSPAARGTASHGFDHVWQAARGGGTGCLSLSKSPTWRPKPRYQRCGTVEHVTAYVPPGCCDARTARGKDPTHRCKPLSEQSDLRGVGCRYRRTSAMSTDPQRLCAPVPGSTAHTKARRLARNPQAPHANTARGTASHGLDHVRQLAQSVLLLTFRPGLPCPWPRGVQTNNDLRALQLGQLQVPNLETHQPCPRCPWPAMTEEAASVGPRRVRVLTWGAVPCPPWPRSAVFRTGSIPPAPTHLGTSLPVHRRIVNAGR